MTRWLEYRAGRAALQRIRAEGLVDHFGSFEWSGEATSTSVSGPDSAEAEAETSGSASFTNMTGRVSLIWEF